MAVPKYKRNATLNYIMCYKVELLIKIEKQI